MRRAGTNGRRRGKMIGVWLTEEEHELLRTLAFEAKKPIGAYVRDRVLSTKKNGRAER